MYLALYRKFRPNTFDEVVGQDHIIRTLKNQIEMGQIGHAYLFCGSRGTGKTSVAKIFAKAVNCKKPKKGSPCFECEVCKSLNESQNIDIIEIDAASNNRVDEIRDIRDKVKYPPIYGKYKVYIIDEVHMLTDSAFNALLKTLEEPPAHIIFILATTEPQKLPATILSRVLRFDFKLVGQNTIEDLIKNVFTKSNIKFDDDAISIIARAGNGSVRDALSIADMCSSYAHGNIKYLDVITVLGTSTQDTILSLNNSVLKSDVVKFIEDFSNEVKMGKNSITLFQDLTKGLRNLLVIKTAGVNKDLVDLPISEQEKLQSVASKYSAQRINQAFVEFSQTLGELKFSLDPQLMIESACLKLAEKIEEKKETNITEHKIWGQVLLELSKVNIIVHSALVNITNVCMQKEQFVINVGSESVCSMVKKPENYGDLVACFRKVGYNYSVLIVNNNDENEDKAKLISEKIGLDVNVKN